LGEKDVMNVFEIVRREFNIDPDRTYLWGHSMGGAGTYHLAAKYPQLWAGLAVAAPGVVPWIERLNELKHLPILVLQGTDDQTVPSRCRKRTAGSRTTGSYKIAKSSERSQICNSPCTGASLRLARSSTSSIPVDRR
jgi:predicted peptidase